MAFLPPNQQCQSTEGNSQNLLSVVPLKHQCPSPVLIAGINTLMYIMSKMASSHEKTSEIHHYERLEFLGDAVIEFLSRYRFHFISCLLYFSGSELLE